MSVIYYKFKAAKDSDYDVFTFDGSGATVFDVKREIIRAKKLGKGTDFDLAIYNAQTDEEYNDDMFMVPRNTSVIVRRLPPSRPGKGTAQRYVQGAAPIDNKGVGASGIGIMKGPTQPAGHTSGRRNMVLNALPQQQQQQQPNQALDSTSVAGNGTHNPFQQTSSQDDTANNQPQGMETDDSEEARIQAMFQQTTDQWGQMQERLAEQQYIPYVARGGSAQRGRGGFPHNGSPRTPDQGAANGGNVMASGGLEGKDFHSSSQRIPPATYVCYRCGQKGHYINQCPTNGDKDYDKHPRIKRTTGIPRSFLKVIEAPKDAVKSGTGGLMVTPKGDIVVAQADSSTWDQHMAKAATALGGDILDWYDSIPSPDYVQCPICQGLMREATITPCCGASFCDECIRGHLLENDFRCFDCQQPIHHGLDGLMPSSEVRLWIDRYVRRYATTGSLQQQQQQQHEGETGDLKNDHEVEQDTPSRHLGFEN